MSDQRFVVHEAAAADVPAIATMIRALAEYEKLSHACVLTEHDLQLALFGPAPAAEVLIATVDGVPAGFALFFHTFSTFLARRGLWLEDLFVYPQHRGRGLGRQLLAHLARVAVERDYGRVEWSVLDWNVDAIGFYRSLGAELLDDWRRCRLAGDAIPALARGA